MSLNSLKIATDGYLKQTTKVALTIAVAGYLNYSNPTPSTGGGGPGTKHHHEDREYDIREAEKQDEIFLLEFLKTATDIINNQ